MAKKFPTWLILVFIGGIITVIGLFSGVVDVYVQYQDLNSNFIYNGIDIINEKAFTWAKFIPTIIGVIGLILAVFSMVVASKGLKPYGRYAIGFLSGLSLFLVIVFFMDVAGYVLIDWDQMAKWYVYEGMDMDMIKQVTSLYIPLEGYLIVIGPLLTAVGSLLSFNEEESS